MALSLAKSFSKELDGKEASSGGFSALTRANKPNFLKHARTSRRGKSFQSARYTFPRKRDDGSFNSRSPGLKTCSMRTFSKARMSVSISERVKVCVPGLSSFSKTHRRID